MSKIYTNMTSFEEAQEKEFRQAVETLGYYQGDTERTTIDGEWTEKDLKEDVLDEAHKLLHDEKSGWLAKNKGRAVLNKDLLHEEFLCNEICDSLDLVEVYNTQYDLHRNDENRKFGIHYFDEYIVKQLNKILKENLLAK